MDAPARTLSVTRAAARFCALRGWAPVEQVPLPDGRRADIVALMPSGDFAIIEVKFWVNLVNQEAPLICLRTLGPSWAWRRVTSSLVRPVRLVCSSVRRRV